MNFSFCNTILKLFCLTAKMFVKMVAKLMFERAVILGIFTGRLVFIKSMKFIKILCYLEMVIVL